MSPYRTSRLFPHLQAHLRPACHAPPAERSKSSPLYVVMRPRVPSSRRRSPRCAPSATLRRSSAATSSMRSAPKPVTMRAAFADPGTSLRRDTAAGARASALAEGPGWSTVRAATLADRRSGCASSPVTPRPAPPRPHTLRPAPDPRPRPFPPPRPALKLPDASSTAGVSAHTDSSGTLRRALLTSPLPAAARRRFGEAPTQPPAVSASTLGSTARAPLPCAHCPDEVWGGGALVSVPTLPCTGAPDDALLVADFLHTRRDGETNAGDADTASRDGLVTPAPTPCSAPGVPKPIVVFWRTRRDGVSGSRALEATRLAPTPGLASISSTAPSSGLASN